MNHALLFNVHYMGWRRPPGPHRIATILREQGWDVEVIDFANSWTLDQLKEISKSRINSNTVFLGFSIMFNMWETGPMEDFSRWLKETYLTIPQVLGGQWPPIHNAEYIDYFVTGYGEAAILELVKNFTGNGGNIMLDPKYLGKNKKVLSGNTFYPSFPMKSLMIKYEDRDYIESWEWLSIEISRGCKFECPYCTYPILGVKGDYSRDADDFETQLRDAYDRWGVTQYFAADETFNDRSEKIVKFADAVENLPFKPWFSGFIRPDLLVSREQDWEHLSRMGFGGQFYGVETFNAKTAKAIKKGMDPKRLQDGLVRAKDYFLKQNNGLYRGLISIVVGLPYETRESVAETFNWLESNWEGEAVSITALEIPTDPTTDVLSIFSTDWKDYGYTDLGEPVVDVNKLKNHRVSISQNLMNSKLNWHNGKFSYDEAIELVEKWTSYSEEKLLFGSSVYTLDQFAYHRKQSNDPLRDVLNMRVTYSSHEKHNQHIRSMQAGIDTYIDKKLNRR